VRSLVDDQTILRRKATSAMADVICSMSPARFWLRDEGRHYDALFEASCAAHDDNSERKRLSDALAESQAAGEIDRSGRRLESESVSDSRAKSSNVRNECAP
jgi:hypothetical protein